MTRARSTGIGRYSVAPATSSLPSMLPPHRRRRSGQDAKTDPAALLVEELPERHRLVVELRLRRDPRREIARLHAPFRIPHTDRIRVVLVLRLRHEREPFPRREAVVLQCVAAV